jgi:prepilin-type N-terminal cleavage/methylation domain-containing protein
MQSVSSDSARAAGFTLIEMSIVLVVIGLIVGAIMVGQNLIAAAAIRAQITQIEKYNSAVNTFRGKYDNGNNASATMTYSIEQNGGAYVNCALSLRFQ